MYIENFVKALNSQELNKNKNYVFDHMVYVRLFEGCNVFCEHCFIPSNPKKINSNYYENNGLTNDLLINSGVKEGSKLYLQWHGGEPTMLGYKYLQDAIENVEKDKRFNYQHGIQTNLVNFHEDRDNWINLYKTKFDNTLGVSWDFAIRHLKKSGLNNLEKANADFEDVFWKNVELVKEADIDIYMVVTVTKKFFSRFRIPAEFYQMLADKGIKKINLERVTKTGMARQHWDTLGLNNLEYADAMARFFKGYILFKQMNPDIDLSVSPFDGLLESVLSLRMKENLHQDKNVVWDILSYKNQGYGCWNGSCDTKFHTIDANGYKKGCTALNSEEDNKNKLFQTIDVKSIKWVKKESLNDSNNTVLSQENLYEKKDVLKQSNGFQNLRANRQLSCNGCEFITICSSGCLSVEKFDESEHCSGAKNLFKSIANVCETQGY